MTRGFTFLIAAMALTAGAAAAAPEFPVSHRAVYEITAAPDVTGNVSGASGLEAMEWRLDCEGGSLFQRTALSVAFDDGGEYESDARITAWEAADASRMRFTTTLQTAGEQTEEISGFAQRANDGQVEIIYSEPEHQTRELAPSTFFPWQYVRSIFNAARAGETGVSAEVLRGTLPEIDPAKVRTQILSKTELTAEMLDGATGAARLTGEVGWRFATAVFEEPSDPFPTFEISETVTGDGVRVQAKMRFADLTLHLQLRALENLPAPVCD